MSSSARKSSPFQFSLGTLLFVQVFVACVYITKSTTDLSAIWSVHHRFIFINTVWLLLLMLDGAVAQEPQKPEWKFEPKLLRPFWQGDTMEGESVLFVKDSETGKAKASVLFPIQQLVQFLELKRDWDLTGNGVNHPNDFGHRVYAQVISALLIPGNSMSAN